MWKKYFYDLTAARNAEIIKENRARNKVEIKSMKTCKVSKKNITRQNTVTKNFVYFLTIYLYIIYKIYYLL